MLVSSSGILGPGSWAGCRCGRYEGRGRSGDGGAGIGIDSWSDRSNGAWSRGRSCYWRSQCGGHVVHADVCQASGLGGMVRSVLQSQSAEMRPGTPMWVLVGGISIELAMLLAVIALGPTPTSREGLRELGLRGLPLERAVLVGVAVVGLMLSVDVVSTLLAGQFGLVSTQVSNAPRFQSGSSPSLAQSVIGSAVAPGIVEELFFRGLLFGFVHRARQPLWLAVLISSWGFSRSGISHLRSDTRANGRHWRAHLRFRQHACGDVRADRKLVARHVGAHAQQPANRGWTCTRTGGEGLSWCRSGRAQCLRLAATWEFRHS